MARTKDVINDDTPGKRPVKTLCIGEGFARAAADSRPAPFPKVILAQTADFDFAIEPTLPAALPRLRREPDTALVLLDADDGPLTHLLQFVCDARQRCPGLPIVVFAVRSGDRTRYLLREGAAWQFTKGARELAHLARALERHLPRVRHESDPPVPLLNPYVVGRPLTGPSESLYVGREDVFAWLAENLHGPTRPNALLLHGRRRVGKTSTLYQVVESRRGHPLRQYSGRPLSTVYLDLQRLAGCRTGEWLSRLAGDISRQTHTDNHSDRPGETTYAALERALDLAERALPAGGLLLIAIDELEQLRAGIENGRLEPEVLPFLRAQIQHRPHTAFLFSGARGVLDPFWQSILDLCARRELGMLDPHATEALIRGPLAGAIAVEDAAVERIWEATAGHPFRIQTICHRLVSSLNEQRRRDAIHAADVAQVLNRLAAEGEQAWLNQSV